MIDVVFQLLIFFIVTLKQEDILARLNVQRPAPDPSQKEETVKDLLTIMIYDPATEGGGEGVSLNKVKTTVDGLDSKIGRITKYSKNVSIVIKCTGASQHATLVKVLNICSKHGLKNLSVFSL
ncbi:MAG: hypothetical protein GWM98_20105 [Nitrospinaceae bacterium]|nr:hypothetical protein [Nitrospinaceae bacterium]